MAAPVDVASVSNDGIISVLPRFTPMPEPLRSNTPGTWAYDTMSRRVLEDIVDKVVYGDNEGTAVLEAARPALDELRAEIASASPLTPIPDDGGPDVEAWNALLAESIEKSETWLTAPWLLSEFYLYRRIAAATGYFAGGGSAEERYDVFAKAKQAGLDSALGSLEALSERASDDVLADPSASLLFLSISLWGNRMDLSLWPAGMGVAATDGAFEAVLATSNDQLLADDSAEVLALLEKLRAEGASANTLWKAERCVDLVVDNAGFELCTDLILADHLLSSNACDVVRLRVKHHPTFVSDALSNDVAHHADALCSAAAKASHPGAARLAARWRGHLDSGKLVCVDDAYWAMPYPMWRMTLWLRGELSESRLTVVKGDANYRRVLGDCPWPYAAPFADVASYFPSPLLCLRTLKAELGCGMPAEKTSRAAATDATWLTDGKWGVMHFAPASKV